MISSACVVLSKLCSPSLSLRCVVRAELVSPALRVSIVEDPGTMVGGGVVIVSVDAFLFCVLI
jgi:hypothetical protein